MSTWTFCTCGTLGNRGNGLNTFMFMSFQKDIWNFQKSPTKPYVRILLPPWKSLLIPHRLETFLKMMQHHHWTRSDWIFWFYCIYWSSYNRMVFRWEAYRILEETQRRLEEDRLSRGLIGILRSKHIMVKATCQGVEFIAEWPLPREHA